MVDLLDWVLKKAESLPFIGERAAEMRQERVWNDPQAVAAHAEWMTEVVRINDENDRLYPDPGMTPVMDYVQSVRDNEHEQDVELDIAESDREWMTPEQWRHAYGDTSNDYAEAYADVAGDATLVGRLENEDPRDILSDVRQQAHEAVFGMTAQANGQVTELRSVREEATEILARTTVAYEQASSAEERSELRTQAAELSGLVNAVDAAIHGADTVRVSPLASGHATDVQLQQQSDFIASVRPLVERIEAVGIEVQAETNEASRDDQDREHEDLER
jgi:hypothetical protein